MVSTSIVNSKTKSRQIFIFSSAGKPIYSYGVKESSFTTLISSSLTAIMGKLSFVLSQEKLNCNYENKKNLAVEYLRWMCSNTHRVVIIERQGVYLCCISTFHNDPIAYIKSILEYTYYQLIMLLTGSIHKALKLRPNIDIQQMITHSDTNIIDQCIRSIQVNVDSLYWYYSFQKNNSNIKFLKGNYPDFPIKPLNLYIEVEPLDPLLRKEINRVICKINDTNLLGGAVFSSARLVTWFGSKYIKNLPSTDLSLLKNITTSLYNNNNSSNELWVPICLPCISTVSYIYCYIHYWPLSDKNFNFENICFVLLSSSNNTEVFEKFSIHSNYCFKHLTQDPRVNKIIHIHRLSPVNLIDLLFKEQTLNNIEIYHFMYLSLSRNCYVSIQVYPEVQILEDIFHMYYKIIELAHSQLKRKKDFSITLMLHTKINKFLAVVTHEFHLLLTLPILSKFSENHLNVVLNKIRDYDKYFWV